MKLVATAVITAIYGSSVASVLLMSSNSFALDSISNKNIGTSKYINQQPHADTDGPINTHITKYQPNGTSPLVANHNNGNTKTQVVKSSRNNAKASRKLADKFTFEPSLDTQVYTYIIQLNEQALGQHSQSAESILNARNQNSLAANSSKSSNRTSNSNSSSGKQGAQMTRQLNKIRTQKNHFQAQAKSVLGKFDSIANYEYALNGMAVRLTQADAQKLAELPHVKSIIREKMYQLNTDTGPTLIGAPSVWNGSASNTAVPSQGEGIIIGVIDSGVNTDHPSFAERSGDGYVHTNPLGDGVYLGDCANDFPELCNNKLIGVRSYPRITDVYSDIDVFPPNLPQNGEDYGGHGSHVASIAAGNVLQNVAEVLPEQGAEESGGIATGFLYEQISGVAPRANVVSYQVCFGGTTEAGDTYGDCPGSAIIQGIEDAIRDGVDVINFSISGGGDPWRSNTELAFLSARNAGIFVATSAGNSGPDAGSTMKNAPWYTSVAAAEHGRQSVFAKQITNVSGGTSFLAPIDGQSNSGSVSAPIVYAGDFTNPNDPNGDPAQCLESFPVGTFNGQIVVCDRGAIARVEKAQHVADGGAGGYVLANVEGGVEFLANDQYVVPGIHINAQDGTRLKQWLSSGSDHRATITRGEPAQGIDQSRVDVLANFSSRGPNTTNSTLTPTLTAPGVDIYAAYADQQFGHDGQPPAASDFNFLSGTSMSSPHVAGAAALIKSVNPSWSVDEVRSALSLTTTSSSVQTNVDGELAAADFFDKGAGRINVDLAIASGLVMSETSQNYIQANPAIGGDPRALNLPSITDSACVSTCTWTRTFRATTDASWTVTTDLLAGGLDVSVTPSNFSLIEGQSQTLTFAIDASSAPTTQYSFAAATLSSPGLPDATLPISVLPSIGGIPLSLEYDSGRQIDSTVRMDIDAIDIPNFVLSGFQPVKATVVAGNISEDSDPEDLFDNLSDGVQLTDVTVAENAVRLIAEIKRSTASDLDLFMILDSNNNGIPERSEVVAQSTSPNSREEIAINYPQAGNYFIAVQSFSGSSENSDSYDMRYAVVTDEVNNDQLRAIAPNVIQSGSPFNLRVIHNLPDSQAGDDYYGAIAMGTSQAADDIGLITIDINRIADDVSIEGTPTRLSQVGASAFLSVLVGPNTSLEDRSYRIEVPLPAGTEFGDFSPQSTGSIVDSQIVWEVFKAQGDRQTDILNLELRLLEGASPGILPVVVQSQLIGQDFFELESSPSFELIEVEGAPQISFNGNDTLILDAVEAQIVTIPLNIFEPNSDAVNVVWTQTAGPTAVIVETNGIYQLTTPTVEADQVLMFDVIATDINNNASTASIVVNVANNEEPPRPVNNGGNGSANNTGNEGGGGSMSAIFTLLLLPIVMFRRVSQKTTRLANKH